MEILALLFLLQVKHFYADFFIQTYDQTIKKGVYGDLVGLSHSLDHALWTILAFCVFSIYYPINVKLILLIAFIELLLHYHIDYFKIRFGTKDSTTSRYWREFGLDQLLHQFTYLGIVWYTLF